ncbi:hypothetical protein BGLA2_180064 [Burkholderia gladioli]|nr:hypothetical protein BGLA2_180064 [Burkholderia gladioli]
MKTMEWRDTGRRRGAVRPPRAKAPARGSMPRRPAAVNEPTECYTLGLASFNQSGEATWVGGDAGASCRS